MKEYKELFPLFATFKSSRDAYESSFKKVKKSTTANPKEEKSMQHLKRYYSYHLNSFLNVLHWYQDIRKKYQISSYY